MSVTTFISYSHDSGTHEDRVLALADQLRKDGVDVRIDQYIDSPCEGWPRWAERQIEACRFVVLVFTPTYRRRYDLAETGGSSQANARVTWETMTIRHLLYEAGGLNIKVLPVLFEGSIQDTIPLSLRAWDAYQLPESYEALLRRLHGRHWAPPQPLGIPPALPPVPRPSFFALTQSETTELADRQVTAGVSASPPQTARPTSSALLTLPQQPEHRATIVVFTANGVALRPHLRLGKELRAIKRALERSRHRDRYRLLLSPMASFSDVIAELDEHEPAFVHFGGHGESGRLVLESEREGEEVIIKPQEIEKLLGELRYPPMLVTFTACSSNNLAKAAARHAAFAIGFDGALVDASAPLFSATLYERLTSHAELDVVRALRMTTLACLPEGHHTVELARLHVGPAQGRTLHRRGW